MESTRVIDNDEGCSWPENERAEPEEYVGSTSESGDDSSTTDDEGDELRFGAAVSSTAGTDDHACRDFDLPHAETNDLQRQLHLFKCPSVQKSIQQIWNVLPLDEVNELTMQGYIELNLRLQRSLGANFELQRAVNSAVGDWQEDVAAHRNTISAEEFAMLLFELCALWCGGTVLLGTYLFFFNAMFINITEAHGTGTIGLKPLASIRRLPDTFHEALQSPKLSNGVSNGDHLGFRLSLTQRDVQETFRQVQRHVYEVLHDIRAIFLFQGQDGRPRNSLSSERLGLALAGTRSIKHATTGALPSAMPRSASLGALETQAEDVPAATPGPSAIRSQPAWQRQPRQPTGSRSVALLETRPMSRAGSTTSLRSRASSTSSVNSVRMMQAVVTQRTTLMRCPDMFMVSEEVVGPPKVFNQPQHLTAPPYKLPKDCPDVYKKQWQPILRQKPGHVAYVLGNRKYEQTRGCKPFGRCLQRMPQELGPTEDGPINGPMAIKPDPLFPEMQKRLEVIMRKQGKRADRRRKRRNRSRRLHDRNKASSKHGELFRELVRAFDSPALSDVHGLERGHQRPASERGALPSEEGSMPPPARSKQAKQQPEGPLQPQKVDEPPSRQSADVFYDCVRTSLLGDRERPHSLDLAQRNLLNHKPRVVSVVSVLH